MNAVDTRVDTARLGDWVETFASLNDDPSRGVTRLAYSATERAAHAVFAEQMTSLGLRVWTDAVGNTLAELTGSEPDLPMLVTGSHLDSVPRGGRFDGIAGVAAAMEVATVLTGRAGEPRRTHRFVAFAAEEGARFGQACNGSRVIAGLTSPEDIAQLHDADGVSMAEAMREVGLRPEAIDSARWNPGDVEAFLELHIEQGVVLERDGTDIGIVDAISGSSRALVTMLGRPSHSGGTPMDLRADALAAAAECVLLAEELAKDHLHHGCRITVGRLDVSPNAMTTIPGSVTFSLDVRDLDSMRQRQTIEDLLVRFGDVARRRGLRWEWEAVGDTSPVYLSESLVALTERACDRVGVSSRQLSSGASHDAQQMGHLTRAGMIFVPSRDGISHDADEHTEIDEIARGVRVLLECLDDLDAER